MSTPSIKPLALVTGASKGIGAATASLLVQRGFRVCITYLSDKNGATAVVNGIEAAGGDAIALKTDVSERSECEALFAAVKKHGRLSAVVNNAGITGAQSKLQDADPDMIKRVIDTNVLGLIYCSQLAVRQMSTEFGGQGGDIVNISSAASTIGSPGEYVWYAASKGAVDSFTLGLAKEVAHVGVRVNAVNPGIVETDIHAKGGEPDRVKRVAPLVPMQRAGQAEEIAKAVAWLLSGEASYSTGITLRVAGGR